jgi:hypothetical protein
MAHSSHQVAEARARTCGFIDEYDIPAEAEPDDSKSSQI